MIKLLYGVDVIDGIKTLADESVNCVVTSPPYWGLRDYGVKGQLGLEKTPEAYIEKMVEIFHEVRGLSGPLPRNHTRAHTSPRFLPISSLR